MHDRLRLHVIEMELDNTEPDSPFRVSRQKLNREKTRILKRLEGRDPRWFAGVGAGKIGEGGRKNDYLMKKRFVEMMDELER